MPASRLQRFAWPAYIAVLLVSAGSTLLVEVGAHAIGGSHHHSSPSLATDRDDEAGAQRVAADSACARAGATKVITITNQGFSPTALTVALCDRLEVRNGSTETINVAFGPHDHHLDYPGFAQQTVKPGASATGTLQARGSFELHDHLHDAWQAQLTIN